MTQLSKTLLNFISCFTDNKDKEIIKKTLVLDLDETLIHSTFQRVEIYDFTLEFSDQNGLPHTVYVNIRPFAIQFIQEVSKYFNLYVFTSSRAEYAQKVVDRIDPLKKIMQILSRDDCTFIEGNSYKDLRKLKTGLKNTILLDNSDISFDMQPQNGLQIEDFINDKSDVKLQIYLEFLKLISQFDDVRSVSNHFEIFVNGDAIEYIDSDFKNKVWKGKSQQINYKKPINTIDDELEVTNISSATK